MGSGSVQSTSEGTLNPCQSVTPRGGEVSSQLNPSGSQLPSVPVQMSWITCNQVTCKGSSEDVRGREDAPSSSLFWNLCGPSVQPTAPGGAAPSSLVLGYWVSCQLHAMGQQSCLFLVFPVFPARCLAAESHTDAAPEATVPPALDVDLSVSAWDSVPSHCCLARWNYHPNLDKALHYFQCCNSTGMLIKRTR